MGKNSVSPYIQRPGDYKIPSIIDYVELERERVREAAPESYREYVDLGADLQRERDERERKEKRRQQLEQESKIRKAEAEKQERLRKEAERKAEEERIKEEKARQEKEELYNKQKQREEEDRDYENWLKEKTSWMGPLSKPVQWAFSADGNMVRKLWDISNELGSLVDKQLSTYIESKGGDISLNDIRINGANAHKRVVNIENQIAKLEQEQNQFARESGLLDQNWVADNKDTDEYQQKLNKYNTYLSQIQDLYQQLNNPYDDKLPGTSLKDMDDLYKADFVQQNQNQLKTLGGFLYDQLRGLGTTVYAQNNLQNIAQDRTKELASRYNDELERTKYSGYGGVRTNTSPYGDTQYDLTKTDDNINKWKAENIESAESVESAKYAHEKLGDFFNVAESYKKGEQVYQNASLFDSGYWHYVFPGTVGSSFSSLNQAAATGMQVAGVAATVATGNPAFMNIGTLASAPNRLEAAKDENKAESFTRRIDNLFAGLQQMDKDKQNKIINQLLNAVTQRDSKNGHSAEWIKEQYNTDSEEGIKNLLKQSVILSNIDSRFNITDPEFKKALIHSTAGVQALYEADNMRTISMLPFELAFEVYGGPLDKAVNKSLGFIFKPLEKGASRVLKGEAEQVGERAAQEAATSTGAYKNGFRRKSKTTTESFRSGFDTGSAVGASLGFGSVGSVVTGAAAGTVNAAVHIAKEALPKQTRAMLDSFEQVVSNKYMKVYDKLLKDREWIPLAGKYGYYATKQVLGRSMEEGAEEAVQYINSKKDFASRYGFGGMSFGDLIINDLVQGKEVLKAYGSLFGLTDSKYKDDAEFWQNVKGGFALGGGMTAVTNVTGSIKDYAKQIDGDRFVVQNFAMAREADKMNRAASVQFAKAAMNGNVEGVKSAIKTRMQHDSMRENPEYTQEEYDAQLKQLDYVSRRTNDPITRAKLEAKGIRYGSDEYANAIADLASLDEQKADNRKATNKNNADLNAIYYSKEFNDEAQEVADEVMNSNDSDVQESVRKAGETAASEYLRQEKELGHDTSTDEFKTKISEVRKSAEDSERERLQATSVELVRNITRAVNKLHGLLKLKSKVSTINDWYKLASEKFGLNVMRPDAKLITKNIEKQIQEQKQFLKEAYSAFNENASDAETVRQINAIRHAIRIRQEDAEQLELENALINANSEVVQNYINQFEEGIVVNKEGKFEYNPAQKKIIDDRAKRYMNAVLSGKKEEAEKIQQEQEAAEYDETKVKDNPYAKRVNDIIESNKRNAALDWMVQDIAEGDAVSKAYEVYQEQKEKEKAAEQKTSTVEDPFANKTVEQPTNSKSNKKKSSVKGRLDANKRKYEAKMRKIKESYERKRASYKKFRRSTLNSGIPFMNEIVFVGQKLFNYFLPLGYYGIKKFVEDIQITMSDKDVKSALDDIKRVYIGKQIQLELQQPELAQNMDSPEVVLGFVMQDDVNERKGYVDPQPVPLPTTQSIKKKFVKMRELAIPQISGYYDTIVRDGDNVQIYTNRAAVEILSEEDKNSILQIVDKLDNLSDEDLIQYISQYLSKETVDEYAKHLSVAGIKPAIARAIFENTLPVDRAEGIKIGKVIRDNVINIMLGNYDSLIKIGFTQEQWDDFIRAVEDVKSNITNRGYTILDTMQPIYTTTKDGSKISAEADIIVANDNGDIQIIDVTYGFASVISRLSAPRTTKVTLDIIYRNEDSILTNIENIITNLKEDVNLKGSQVFCFVYNDEDALFYTDGLVTLHEAKLSQDEINNNIQRAKTIVDSLNQSIDDYNALAEQLHQEKRDKLDVYAYSTQKEFDDYFNYLSDLQEVIKADTLRLRELSQSQHEEEEVEIIEPSSENTPDDFFVNFSAAQLYDDLKRTTKALDDAMTTFPIGRIVTDQDHQNIIQIYKALFDAQIALNEFLQHPDADLSDVQHECEIIANTLETIHQNRAFLGRDAIFVQKWWLTKFTLQDGTVHDTSEYINQINAWVKTLKGYVDTNDNMFDEHPSLAQWYSSVINTYFKKLVDQADKAIQPSNRQLLDKVILNARDLISRFNLNWGVEPDKTYDAPAQNELEYIERMPLRWVDLYGISESHSPAIDQMANRQRPYYYFSQRPDFLQKATFSFGLNADGNVQVLVKYEDKFAYFTFENNDAAYGRNLTDEISRRNRILNRGNRKFVNKLKAMINYRIKHPEYDIVVDAFANKGSIHYSSDPAAENNVVDTIFSDPNNKIDLYNVTISEGNYIGVLSVIRDNNNNPIDYKIKTGPNLKSDAAEKFDKEFKKRNLKSASGMIVYFFDYGDGRRIGIPMTGKKIGNDASKLVSLIRDASNGKTTQDGYGIIELLQMRLFLQTSGIQYLSSFNNRSNLIEIVAPNQIKIGGQEYNLETQRDQVISIVSNMHNVVPGFLLSTRISNTTPAVVDKFRSDPNLQQVTLPNGIVVTRDDITNNSTWLGHFFRNGIIVTRAEKNIDKKYPQNSSIKGYRQINFANPRLVKKSDIQGQPNAIQSEDRSAEQRNRISNLLKNLRNPSLNMTINKEDIVNRSSKEQAEFINEIREFFDYTFGTSDDIKFEFERTLGDNLSFIGEDEVIAGECTSQLIRISTYAPKSVMYHEAFHKIIELILPNAEREALYKAYREKHGKNMSERAVAEALADLFVDYMQNKKAFREAKWYNKPRQFFKKVGILASLVNNLGAKQAIALFMIYRDTNKGRIMNRKNDKEVESKIKRFQEKFNDHLYKTIESRGEVRYKADFKYLTNSYEVYEMCKSLGYLLGSKLGLDNIFGIVDKKVIDERSLSLIDDATRRKLCNLDDNDNPLPIEEGSEHKVRAWREMFETKRELRYDEKGNPYWYVSYPKFAAIHTMVGDYLSSMAGDYKGKFQVAEEDDTEEERIQRKNIDKYDKASIEFNKLDGTTAKVKLFFGTIPYSNADNANNMFGTNTYMPLEEVYNIIVNDHHRVRTIDELMAAIKHDASYNPMYATVHNKLDALYQKMYTQDENGNTVVDYDAESTMIQILMTIRSQKHDFKIAETTTDKAGVKSTQIKRSSSDRDTKVISRQWQQILVSGQVGIFQHGTTQDGKLAFRQSTDKKVFDNLVEFFDTIIKDLSQNADLYPADSAVEVRKEIVRRLNQIGILISDKALEHMLVTKYHGVDANAIYKWLTTQTKETSITPFLAALKQFAPNGVINDSFIKDNGFAELSFVTNLANAEGLYRRITTQQMALGLNGKKLYSISQNSTISKICDDLSVGDRNSQFIRTLLNFKYNLYDDGLSKRGSLIARHIADGTPVDLRLFTFIGSKSDNKGDTGSSYTEQATVDDYMAKLAMLQSGSIIMPTLADKSMYQAIDTFSTDGQKMDLIPGMKFIQGKGDKLIAENVPTIAFMGNHAYLRPSDAVLRQMIEYAVTEKMAIEQCIEDLKHLSDDEKIKNYHTANKDGVEPNGTRFLVFTEVVVVKNGKPTSINFNDPNKSSQEMLNRANEYFFSKPIDEQMTIMAQTLAMQTMFEVQKAEELGLVSREEISIHNLVTDSTGKTSQQVVINDKASNKNSLLNLVSTQLNMRQIGAIEEVLLETMPQSWKQLNKPETLPLYNERRDILKSLAIAAILQDATLRSIISSQEVLRCFCGHPGMFKVNYNKALGCIEDSTFDLQKRIGGMISTGDDNVINLPNIKATYTCAEIKDYEIGVPDRMLQKLQDTFETGMLADLYYRYSRDDREGNNDIDIAMRVKSHELIPEAFKITKTLPNGAIHKEGSQKWFKFVDNVINRSKQYADTYKEKINVADGAAYITADMCRDMLRMNGRLDEKAIRALDILTNSSTQYSWMQSAEAYKDIYDAINITPTKYTAYGFREHTINDNKCSDVAVPYYNKFALFPIFPCMATGNMASLYEKMQTEGVDMVLMDSAVKIGSQGAVKYDGSKVDKPFNKYTQEFSFIRKQLNTDPEEGSTSAVGSQVLKVGLQNLILDKVYQDFQTGENIVGQSIYDNIMNDINELAKIGVKSVMDKFMVNGVCDQQKLSEYLNEQLNARNANSATIEAIQTHKENGVSVLNMPLAATADANWIESIIISLMKKEVIDINAPGSSFIQRSIFAIEGGGNPNLSVNDGKKLQMINSNGSMDCILSMDYFTNILFANHMIGRTFEEQRNWLIEHKIIGNSDDVKANTIGYRVPTQAQSSIHSLRCVDVLPACKNTIILPEEFTKITGADFDIDHLYLWSYNYFVDNKGNVSLKNENDEETSKKKHLQNDLLTNMLTLVNSVENSMHFLYKSIDSDTQLLKNVSDKLYGNISLKHRAFNFGTLHEQIDRKNDYITGKMGIGPYALNVTNQELTRLNGVRFADTIVTRTTRISRLDNIVDKDDNSIAAWESGYINGHVDIVKDPFVSVLNINQFTYNLSNLLTRCGFSETTLWFLCQPIIRKMAIASNSANGQYTRDGQRGIYSIREAAIANACVEVTGKDENTIAELLDRIKNPKNKDDYNYIANCINYIEKNAEILQQVAIETNRFPFIQKFEYVRNDGIKMEINVKDVQLQVLKAYTALDKYQRSLGKLVQYTKIDTKNYGKSLIQTRRYLKIYNDLVHPQDPRHHIFDMGSINRLINDTWIEYKTRHAIMLPFKILGGQVFNANDSFINKVLDCADILNTGEDVAENMVDEISKSMITAIKSNYIINYARTFSDGYAIKPKSDQDIAKLFTSSDSLSKRLNRLLDQIRNNPAYTRLSNNYLLQSISSEFEEDPVVVDNKYVSRPSFISISANVGDNKSNADMFSDAWEDLLNDDDQYVRNFANDLIIYAFLTSGEYNGWTHMFKYVPYNWKVGKTRGFDHNVETYSQFTKRMLAGGLSEIIDNIGNFDVLDDVVANNFMNSSIIRSSRIVEQDHTVNFAVNPNGNLAVGRLQENQDDAPKYITLKKPSTKGKNQNDYRVYKLMGFYKGHPVYAEIQKRGYHHKGYDIYEYGWSFNYAENKSTNSAVIYEDDIIQALKTLNKKQGIPQTDLSRLIGVVAKQVNETINDKEKVPSRASMGPKQNGNLTYRPVYNFGRIYLTDRDRQHVTEHVNFTVNGVEYSDKDIDILEQLRFLKKFDIDSYGENNPDQKLSGVPNSLYDTVRHLTWYIYGNDTNSIDSPWQADVSDRVLKMAEQLKQYERQLRLLDDVLEYVDTEKWDSNSEYSFVDLLEEYMNEMVDIFDGLTDDENITYSYDDDRQLNLFNSSNTYHESFDKVNGNIFVKDNYLQESYKNKMQFGKDMSVQEVLEHLQKSDNTKAVLKLIEFISNQKGQSLLPKGLKISIVSGIAMPYTAGSKLQGHRACYDADSNTIYIDSDSRYENGDASSVILHELMHAITLSLLENNPQARNRLEGVLNIYRKNYPDSYSRIDSHSLAEFVADIWTNPLTIKRLKEIPYKSESLFDRIINILKQLFKSFFKEDTLFAEASKALVELLESTPPNMKGTSGIYYNTVPTIDQIQKEYDDIADKIRNLFGELYQKFDKMPEKTTARRRTQTEIFKTISRLKSEQSEKAIEIALESAAEQLGLINTLDGTPQSSDNLYAWFVNQEAKDIPYEGITPQQIQDVYKHQIGFYRSVLATIPDGSSVLLNSTTRLNRKDILDQLDIIENFWKHAVELIGEREIDNMIDEFTGLAIPQDQKENMKIVYRDWLHKNWFYGDMNAFTSLFTSYGQSGNPIVSIAFHLTQYAEQKTQEELLAKATPLLKKFQSVNTLGSWVKPGWQKVFQEVNRKGIPTGKWVRDINYGQYEQDLNQFVADLNDDFDNRYGFHYIYDDLGMVKNSVTGQYAEDEQWIGGLQPPYVEYLLEQYRWKCEHANLPYEFEYYKERLSRPYDEHNYIEGHGLSLKTLQKYQNIQDTINYYLGLCTKEDGIPHPELPKDQGGLTDAERFELDKAKAELQYISSPFEEDGTVKVDEDYQTAMEIQTWQKYIQDIQHGYDIDYNAFTEAENEAKAASIAQGDPSILSNFYKYNSEVRVDPDFIESIFGVSDNISTADVIIKQIYQKCLENLTKVKDYFYTRNIEPFKNNIQFWIDYHQIVQDVADNKEYDRLQDPIVDVNDVADYYDIPYVDANGKMFDIFGNPATDQTPTTDLLTWLGYIVNHYTQIALSNGGIIPGVDDEYGNPVIFSGSDMQISSQIKDLLFTYEHTWWDKDGTMHTKRRPLPMFTVLIPKDRSLIHHIPTGRFSKPKSTMFTNNDYDESAGIAEQPKRMYYDNTEAYNKVAQNDSLKDLYDSCIQCMQDMQKVMGFTNRTFNYKLPMLNADTAALLSRGSLGSILKSAFEIQNDDTDMRNMDSGIKKADGTIDFDIPLRLLQDLKDMSTLSSDVTQSVLLYIQMAYNYRNKKAIQDTIQTIHDNLTADVRNRTATDYDRFKDNPTDMSPAIDDENSLKQYEAMMDSTLYGMDTGKSSKAHKEATKLEVSARKFGNSIVRFEAVMTLGLNLLSMFAGAYDSMSKMLRESILNRYMSFADLIKSFGYVLYSLPAVIANIENPLPNCKIVAMMQLNGLSKNYTKIFDNLNHNRVVKLANRMLMGGFSMFDYFSNMVLLRAHYRNTRFYEGNVIPKGFYTAYEMRQAFKAAGKSWIEGALAHSQCKHSLWEAYEFDGLYMLKGGKVSIRPEYAPYVTGKIKTEIMTKSLQRSALYNGMAPDNDRARYLKDIWGKVIFAMRNWYQMVLQRNLVGRDDTSVRNVVDTKNERIKFGKTIFKPGKKVESRTEEQSANRMGWNFETNAPQEELWKGLFRASWKLLRLAGAAISFNGKKFKDIKLSNVEKYAIRGIIAQFVMLQLLFYSFIPIMQRAQQVSMPTNKEDAELSLSNIMKNVGDLAILWHANAHIRAYESNKAEINPLEPKAFIKTSSALFGALDHQTALLDAAEEATGGSTHTLDEVITSGSKYKYYTRGERYVWQAIGPANNMVTSATIPGVKYNTQWYMNMYGDAYRQEGYDFRIHTGNNSSVGKHTKKVHKKESSTKKVHKKKRHSK